MNCKPGDLAIVVSGVTTPEMIGYLVTIVRRLAPNESNNHGGLYLLTSDVCWLVEGLPLIPERTMDGRLHMVRQRGIADHHLRPIRPSEGADETLTWAGLPQPSKETV